MASRTSKDYDDTYDWGGFNASLKNQEDASDQAALSKEQLDYSKKINWGNIQSDMGKIVSAIGGGLTFIAPEFGIPLAAAGGALDAAGSASTKEFDTEEKEKELADMNKRKAERDKAPTNQTYGMSLRNSGI